jgi:hypothetical protein
MLPDNQKSHPVDACKLDVRAGLRIPVVDLSFRRVRRPRRKIHQIQERLGLPLERSVRAAHDPAQMSGERD